MSTMRIFGMASGMDIDQIVTDLMKAERTKVDKVEQDKKVLEWRQQLYNDINKDFANFILDTKKEFGLTTSTSTGTLLNNSLSNLSWVKEASSSDETMATVSSTAGALDGSYEITVHRLADGVKAASSVDVGASLESKLAGIGVGETIEFSINGEPISIDENDNMSSIVEKINSSAAGVQASYDASIGRFFIQTSSAGANEQLSITTADGAGNTNGADFIDAMKLNVSSGGTSLYTYNDTVSLVDNIEQPYNGVNALIDFAGANNIEQSSNQFTINGISFNLKNADPTKTFTVKVDTNIDGVYDKINKFVEKYNELVEKMNTTLTEKQYRDYTPLTEEQKEAMSEKEIEMWEKKAKSGLLRNDTIFSRTMQNARSGMYDLVSGVSGIFDHLTDIGITTEKYSSGSAGGKLAIDEIKLKEAISNDADSVLELLFKESSSSVSEDALSTEQIQIKRQESGIITRLYDNMIVGMKDVIGKAGPGDNSSLYRNIKSNLLIDFVTEYGSISTLDKNISNLDDKIYDLNDYLANVEERYYNKFSAMESAIQRMNSQSSWLTQQFSGM